MEAGETQTEQRGCDGAVGEAAGDLMKRRGWREAIKAVRLSTVAAGLELNGLLGVCVSGVEKSIPLQVYVETGEGEKAIRQH